MLDTNLIVIIVLVFIVIILVYWLWKIEQRLKRFFRGSKASSLEENFKDLTNSVASIEEYHKKLKQEFGIIDARLSRSIQGLETVRFNPFSDSGGNQSFAIAFLDEKGNGVVMSSLYSREKTSVFAKPIKGFQSTYELTKEEQEALSKAKIS
jgi:hypothetical protein